MSFTSLVGYTRTDNNKRRELKAQLNKAGIYPPSVMSRTSLFARLCEEEVAGLADSLSSLVAEYLPVNAIHLMPAEGEDPEVTRGRLVEFRANLRRAIQVIQDNAEEVDLASHGFIKRLLQLILKIFEQCFTTELE